MALRKIIKTVPATRAGPIIRLVGSVDYKGQGINHPLEQVDPVVMIDYTGKFSGKGVPGFGLHPHHGLIANTIVIEGSFFDEDNLNGRSEEFNESGDIYLVSSGRGVAHAEATTNEGPHKAIQLICKLPDDKLDLPPEICKVKSANIPELATPEGKIKVLVGKLGNLESPATLKAYPKNMFIGRALINPGAKMEIGLGENDYEHGVIFALDGKGTVLDDSTSTTIDDKCDIVVFGQGDKLVVKNEDASNILDVFFTASKPLNEEWKKLKGFNGFFLAKTEKEADEVLAKIEEVGLQNFSYKVWQ